MDIRKIFSYLLVASLFLYLHKAQAQDAGTLPKDKKLTVKSATASEHQNGEDISKSFDGNMKTLYHSKWSGATFPVTLTYNFEQVDMNYILYVPRQDQNDNGIITKCKIIVKKDGAADYEKELTFKISHSAKVIKFQKQQKNVTQVQFIVYAGANNFVSCAEMEFYASATSSFDYTTIFTDATCSKLKPSVSQSDIDAIDIEYYKTLATDLFNNNYSTEFRVQEYKAWSHPNDFSRENRVGTYSLCDNPTGIYAAAAGEKLAVFVGDMHGYDLSLVLKNFDVPGGDGYYSNQNFSLQEGLNVITTTQPGLFYLFYHTPEHLTAPKIKVHIAYGKVNGYYDSQKHSKADWSKILNATQYKYFDVLGKYAHLSFETQLFKKNAASNGTELIAAYDSLVHQEREFMGYYKFNRNPYNRSHFTVMYKAYMYSAGYHTAYNITTLDGLTKVEQLKKTPWGPAHEVGHSNQHTPLFKWVGMTEVTNNVQSLLIQTSWGNRSRLSVEDKYQAAYNNLLIPQKAHCEPEEGEKLWWKLVPFWQLKLYFHDILGRKDFYKYIYQECRTRPIPMKDNKYDMGKCQLEFVKIVSDIAKMNLTDFFAKWGFLKPIDMEVDDYTKAQLTITEAQSKAVRDYMKKYSEKPDMILQYLTDDNLDIYKGKKEVVKGEYTTTEKNSSTYLTLSDSWKNYVAVEFYYKDKLISVERQGKEFKLPPLKGVSVYAVQYDGKKILVSKFQATGINDNIDNKSQLNIYPTIVKNGFTVEYNNKFNKKAMLEIYSLSGKKVHTERINQNKHYVNTNHLSSGTYIVKLGGKSCKIVVK